MEVKNIRHYKILILLISVLFILSISAAFAVDNSTELSADSADDNLAVDYSDSYNDDSDVLKMEIPETNDTQSIDSGKITKRYNVGVEYSTTFYDSEGKPLENTIVYCGVNNPLYGVNSTTNEKGLAQFLLPIKNGQYTLYLMNPETSQLKTDTVKVFDVITGGKNINAYFNSGKYYTVRVFDNDGKPLKVGQKVTFTVNLKKQTIKTDKNGYAKLKINFQPGTYLVTAQYNDFIVANKIIVKPTLIHLTHFGSKILKKTFKFKVKLLNNKGKVLKNKKIKTKFNKKTYFAKTNKKGIATFTLKTPKKTGKYNIVSSYGKAKATSQLTRFRV